MEPRLHELLRSWPDMPATVIAERIGWTRSMTVRKDRVRELRPVYSVVRAGPDVGFVPAGGSNRNVRGIRASCTPQAHKLERAHVVGSDASCHAPDVRHTHPERAVNVDADRSRTGLAGGVGDRAELGERGADGPEPGIGLAATRADGSPFHSGAIDRLQARMAALGGSPGGLRTWAASSPGRRSSCV